MLKRWHKNDIFHALQARGWQGPNELPFSREQFYYVGAVYSFERPCNSVRLYFVADFGTGFEGDKSIESVVASFEDSSEMHELWLHRTRDSKWRTQLFTWADTLSPARLAPGST